MSSADADEILCIDLVLNGEVEMAVHRALALAGAAAAEEPDCGIVGPGRPGSAGPSIGSASQASKPSPASTIRFAAAGSAPACARGFERLRCSVSSTNANCGFT